MTQVHLSKLLMECCQMHNLLMQTHLMARSVWGQHLEQPDLQMPFQVRGSILLELKVQSLPKVSPLKQKL